MNIHTNNYYIFQMHFNTNIHETNSWYIYKNKHTHTHAHIHTLTEAGWNTAMLLEVRQSSEY